MNKKRLGGWILTILGGIMLVFSFYIKTQVNDGTIQIQSAKKKLKQGNKVLSVAPVTKEIGTTVSKGVQSKIQKAEKDLEYYSVLSNRLLVGGSIFVVLGVGLIGIFPSAKSGKPNRKK